MNHQSTMIVDAIRAAPGWVRVGITAPTPSMRARATEELAAMIAQRLEQPQAAGGEGQLRLSI